MQTISNRWMWVGFISFIIVMLAIDLFLLGGKKTRRPSARTTFIWVAVWVGLAFLFNLLLWLTLSFNHDAHFAKEKALEFFTAYLIEESLSIDNMFVFLMLFNYFSIPQDCQRKILFYGVLGAIAMRLVMILSGLWLIGKFAWILYVFGVFLVFTGVKMLVTRQEKSIVRKKVLNKFYKRFNITKKLHGEKFFIIEHNKFYITPLLSTLVLIEFSDLVFALDSIPAVFAITRDPFIVFTSNIFAILGLRSLYFLLAHMAEKFSYLKYGLGVILMFAGLKILVAPWIHIPIVIALLFIAGVLATSIFYSLFLNKKAKNKS